MASVDDAIFLDDDPRAVDVAAIAEAETRRVGITPHQFAVGTIEFQGLAEALVAKALAFGQTRKGFLTSLASMWDQYHQAYKVLRRAQQHAEDATTRAAAAAAETGQGLGALCDHGVYRSRCEKCGAPPMNASGPADQAPPAEGDWERRADGTLTLRAPCGLPCGDAGPCRLRRGHEEPCTP